MLNLGTASKALSPYRVDLVNSKQIRTETGMERRIRRSEVCISGTPCYGLWEWQDGSNNFNIYNITAMIEIEEAYCLKQPSVDLSVMPSQLPYTIDFNTMYQTRHGFNTRRKIRRTPLLKPLQSYLAGPTASASLMLGSTGTFTYNSLRSSSQNGPTLDTNSPSSAPGSAFSVSLPSVYPSLSRTMTSSSGTSNFDTTSFKSPVVSNSFGVKPNLRSATAATSTRATLSPSKPSKGESSKKATAGVTTRSSAKPKNKSTPTNVIDLTSGSSGSGKTTGKSAKRCKTKVEKPATKDLTFGPGMPYLKKVSRVKKEDDGPCPICMSELSEASGFDEGDGSGVYKLTKCGHMLHTPCVKAYIENSSFSQGNFQCPTCKKIYGIKTGDMPPGSMTVLRQMSSLPGHEGYGTIQITYSFHPGMHMGKRYSTNGFPRTCYLPDSPKGQKVLKLLRKAWDRKLTFTIGTSVTTGASNTIVWNEIHHKTESTTNFSGHGYPDPNYLDNVTAELAAQGVEDSADEESGNPTSDNDDSSDSDL